MKVRVSEATGPVLDWMVATAEGMSWWTPRTAEWDSNYGYTDWVLDSNGVLKKFWFNGARSRAGHWEVQDTFTPSTDWSQGGPIIESVKGLLVKHWLESNREGQYQVEIHNHDGDWITFGPTLLVAAMRCFVVSRLGDEVDVPEELL